MESQYVTRKRGRHISSRGGRAKLPGVTGGAGRRRGGGRGQGVGEEGRGQVDGEEERGQGVGEEGRG